MAADPHPEHWSRVIDSDAVLEAAALMLSDLLRSVEARSPLPWSVGERPTNRSMFPIRDRNAKVVAYAPNALTADLIVRLVRSHGSSCDHDWQPSNGRESYCTRCGTSLSTADLVR